MGFLDEKRCEKCGKSEEYVNLDKHHALTKSRGGTKTIYLCRECHQYVGNHIEEAKKIGWYLSGYGIDKRHNL